MLNKLDAALSFHQNALRVRSQRQEVIAANIANADTPNYKARDIDFKSAMQNALTQGSQMQGAVSDGLSKTSSMHINGAGNNTSAGPNEPLFRPIIQGSVDGNTVDMDVERNQFVDNGLRYEASLTMINGQIKKMLTAITGQ
ncbi:flagellar basal-body rod protein FlgB [Methylophilaceae bacterium 11]|jgi:flagellar basal-body rod protein FlgB|uniref:flagellar basal body rod protein FlgB n=1 Tax=Methylotenera sp. 1P/1 TaxID=1131551 RepID=UPI00037F13D5|nr:flagellar basal body rod protein FlgB [Methylotenera sp. 1P/1]EUJ10703.1 flagellar basal-body rod protein FlgB [Methylophilaceae bacterium 11]